LAAEFPHVSCDLMYGMSGETEDDLAQDIERACSLGLRNLDFYPINNVVTQKKLHRAFRREDKRPVSGLTKFYMNIFLRECLRERGFVPHNGHGYVRVSDAEIARDPVVTDTYS